MTSLPHICLKVGKIWITNHALRSVPLLIMLLLSQQGTSTLSWSSPRNSPTALPSCMCPMTTTLLFYLGLFSVVANASPLNLRWVFNSILILPHAVWPADQHSHCYGALIWLYACHSFRPWVWSLTWRFVWRNSRLLTLHLSPLNTAMQYCMPLLWMSPRFESIAAGGGCGGSMWMLDHLWNSCNNTRVSKSIYFPTPCTYFPTLHGRFPTCFSLYQMLSCPLK